MAAHVENPPSDVNRVATTRHLGHCTSVHKVGSVLRTISISVGLIAGPFIVFLLFGATSRADPVLSALRWFAAIGGFVFLVAGLLHRGEAVYLYEEGLVYVDRTSVVPIRFDEIRLFEKIAQGRRGYRIAGGGYWVRVTSLVDNSAALRRRLEDEARRHGGLIK